MTKTELKPVDELQEKINKLYTKYETEMLPKFIGLCTKHNADYWQMHDMFCGGFALHIGPTNKTEEKFTSLCAAMMAVATVVDMFYPSMSMQKDIDRLKKQIHEYDAPWYWEVVDQVQILA